MTATRTALTTLAAWLCVTAIAVLSLPAYAQTVRHDASTFSQSLFDEYGDETDTDAFTRVQFMRPLPKQRVVTYNGTGYLPNGIGAVLEPNELGRQVEGATDVAIVDSINLATGAWLGYIEGIGLPATMPWTIGVAYNSVADPYTSNATKAGYHGYGWTQISQPEIFFYSESDPDTTTVYSDPDPANDVLYVVFGTGRYAAYKRESAASDYFVGVNGVGGVVRQDAATSGAPEFFTLIDQRGQQFVFFGFGSPTGSTAYAPAANGQLWKKVATDGLPGVSTPSTAYVGHETDPVLASTSGYDSAGRITDAYDSEGHHFDYTYQAGLGGSADFLQSVVAYPALGSTSELARVEYTYFQTGDGRPAPTNGVVVQKHPERALRSVVTTTPDSSGVVGSGLQRTTYLRYAPAQTLFPERTRLAAVFDSEGVGNASSEFGGTGGIDQADLAVLDGVNTSQMRSHMSRGFSHHFQDRRVMNYFTSGDCGGCAGASGVDSTVYITYKSEGSQTVAGPDETSWYLPMPTSGVSLTDLDEFEIDYGLDPAGMPMWRLDMVFPEDGQTTPEEPCESRCVTSQRRDENGTVVGVTRTNTDCTYDLDYLQYTGLGYGELCTGICIPVVPGDVGFDNGAWVLKPKDIAVVVWARPYNMDMQTLNYEYTDEPCLVMLTGTATEGGASVSYDEGATTALNRGTPLSASCRAALDIETTGLDPCGLPDILGPHDPGGCVPQNFRTYVTQKRNFLSGGAGTMLTLHWDIDDGCQGNNGVQASGSLIVSHVQYMFGGNGAGGFGTCAEFEVLMPIDLSDFAEEVPDQPLDTPTPGFPPQGIEFPSDFFPNGVGEPTAPYEGDPIELLPAPDSPAHPGAPMFARTAMGGSTSVTGASSAYSYDWYGGDASLRPRSVTRGSQMVSTARNGSGASNETNSFYRSDGTPAFVMHPDGRVDYTRYDGALLVESVRDVTSGYSFDVAPASFTGLVLPGTGFGEELVTTFAYDGQGRIESVTRPSGLVSKTLRTRLLGDQRVVVSYNERSGVVHGPASVSVSDRQGRTVASGSIAFAGGTTLVAASAWIDSSQTSLQNAVSTGTLVSLSEYEYEGISGRLTRQAVYYDIAGNGYDETLHTYDDRGRRIESIDPTGTITRAVYDSRNRVIEEWIGTDSTGFVGTPGGSGGGDMTLVASVEYDFGQQYGPNLVTARTVYPGGGATPRTIEYIYDGRRRLKAQVNPLPPHMVYDHDSADRVVFSAAFVGDGSQITYDLLASAPHPDRVSLSQTVYDERGRVFETILYGVHRSGPSAGDLNGEEFVEQRWYDANGRVAKTAGTSVTKMSYDAAGRLVRRALLADDLDTGSYPLSVSGVGSHDLVLSQTRTIYDAAGRATTTIGFERRHDQDETVLGGLESINTDFTDDTKARVSVSSVWYDDLDRVTHAAVYGTVDTLPTYTATPPASSGTVFVSETRYNDAGRVYESVDAKGTVTRMEHDDLGRTVAVIENYVDGVPGPNADTDRKTSYVYTDGNQTSMTAHQSGGLPDQTTEYVYGVPKGPGVGESVIASNRMLYTAKYPDEVASSGTAVVMNAYNALGEPIESIDQGGNRLETTYDALGRPTTLFAASINTAAGYDDAVDTIETAYDDLGQVTSVTQKKGATVLDQVVYTFDDWGQLEGIFQDYNSVVGKQSSIDHVSLEYTHDVVHANTVHGWQGIARAGRTIKGPGSSAVAQELAYQTGAANSLDWLLLRTGSVEVSNGGPLTPVVTYDYLGAGRVVGTNMPITTGVDVRKNLYDAAGDYTRIDRFGRVTTDLWEHSGAHGDNAIIDRAILHDSVGNILAVDHNVFGADRKYALDGLYRLTSEKRGVPLTPRSTSTWTYDALGNQLDLDRDFDTAVAFDLLKGDLARVSVFDEVNALQTYDDDGAGSSPQRSVVHDAVGNLTDDGEAYERTYDVFGRLVATHPRGTSDDIARYRYNGVGQRIAWLFDNESTPDGEAKAGFDTWVYGVYDERWRLIAEIGSTTAGVLDAEPTKQWVHHHAGLSGRGGSSYIDALVLVDEDTNGTKTLDSRRRYVQNWRYDVVAMLGTNGVPLEVLDYTPYGESVAAYRGDFDNDGDCDLTDYGTFGGEFGRGQPGGGPACSSSNPCVADFDYDGDVDLTDFTAFGNDYGGRPGKVALPEEAAGRGYAGYVHDASLSDVYHVRNRVYLAEQGRWSRKDPLGHGLFMPLLSHDMPQLSLLSPVSRTLTLGSNSFSYASCKAVSTQDPTGLVTWDVDETACTITMESSVSFTFNGTWSAVREQQYKRLFESEIESAWNTHSFKACGKKFYYSNPGSRLYICGIIPIGRSAPSGKVICPCECWDLKVDIQVVPTGGSEFTVEVGSGRVPAGVSQRVDAIGGTRMHVWENSSVHSIRNVLGENQVVVAHEFGHLIGLRHPGDPKSPYYVPYKGPGSTPSRWHYAADQPSLMGAGMAMRSDYFVKWKDEMNAQYPKCGPFSIK